MEADPDALPESSYSDKALEQVGMRGVGDAEGEGAWGGGGGGEGDVRT